MKHIYFLFLSIIMFTSCNGQKGQGSRSENITQTDLTNLLHPLPDPNGQIGEYVRHVYQDKKGNLWLGTIGLGVAKYDGKVLQYFSDKHGLSNNQINGISEDGYGNIWFATGYGVTKYDPTKDQKSGKMFTTYTTNEGLNQNSTWSIFADSKSNIWVGTIKGVSRLNAGEDRFSNFPMPKPTAADSDVSFSALLAWSIFEDTKGNIWFGMDGDGVYKCDLSILNNGGSAFTHLTKSDGLCDMSIDGLIEDSKGNFWFGSRFGGMCQYNPSLELNEKAFSNYSVENKILGNNEVCAVYEDRAGNIWCSSEGFGVYRYDGKEFKNFAKEEGLGTRAPQTIFEDKEGRLWVGGGGGLYRLEGETFINVKRNGPWK